jgi:non-ribosomal peptide synthase protein (TIGR01720 family)
LLKELKKQIRAIPHHGLSFGLLRYLNNNEAVRETLGEQKAQISFNYLGQIDSQLHNNSNNNSHNNNLFGLSNAPTGSGMFELQERPHLLAINARVQEECLVVDWSYSKNIHNAETIKQLAESFLSNLGAYLLEPTSTESSFYSATDFHLVDLTEGELDSLLSDLA